MILLASIEAGLAVTAVATWFFGLEQTADSESGCTAQDGRTIAAVTVARGVMPLVLKKAPVGLLERLTIGEMRRQQAGVSRSHYGELTVLPLLVSQGARSWWRPNSRGALPAGPGKPRASRS